MKNRIPSINEEIDFLNRNQHELYCISDWVQTRIQGKMIPVRITAIHHDGVTVRNSSYNNIDTLDINKILENLHAILSNAKNLYSTKAALCVQYASILIEVDHAIVRLSIDKNILKSAIINIKGKWHVDYEKWANLIAEASKQWGYKDFKQTDDVCYFYPGFEYKQFISEHESFWTALHEKLDALIRILKELASLVNGGNTKKSKTSICNTPDNEGPLLYISYSWSVDSEMNDLCSELKKKGIPFSRDVNDCGYKDSIKQFEEKIGKGARVLAYVNDKYLKSIQCMYELALVFKHGDVENRIFPIVDIVDCRDASFSKELFDYWNKQYQDKKAVLNELPSGASLQAIKELGYCDHIIRELPKIVNYLSEVNTLTIKELSTNNFELLINKLCS